MRIRLILAGLFIVFLIGVPVFAQGNLLNYGSSIVGTLSANNPLAFYTFSGAAGDLVTVQVIGITAGLDPAVSLNSPTQQQLANNDNDPTAAGSTDARISYSLSQNGIYSILVSSVSAVNGDFLIRLSGQQPVPATVLTDVPQDVPVVAGQPQIFSFEADPANPLTLTVSAGTSVFQFRVIVRDPNGEIVALLTSSTQIGLNLPAGSGTYTVEITAVDPNIGGQVTVSVGTTAAAPAPVVQPPVATEEVSAPPVQDTTAGDVCEVGAQGSSAVNVRSGPGTDFGAIAQIQPGSRLEVTGYYTTWYQVAVPGIGPGWVRQDVVVQFGPCDTIPQVEAPQGIQPPVQTEEVAPDGPVEATPTYTPTATTAQQEQTGPTATYTYTPTTAAQEQQSPPTPTATTAQQDVQPTATYTPSYTPTVPVPTAPPDANFNSPLNIPLDSTASVTDFVSYPGGDREDRVRWDITGMNPNSALSGGRARLILAVSCFGTGTQNITFFTGGQTFSCGQTIVDQEVTYDSRTGQVTITAVAGQNTYVQWVLTGTATRVN